MTAPKAGKKFDRNDLEMAIDKKVVLVVGGSGFLGRAIVQAAAQTMNVFSTHKSHSGPRPSIKFDLLEDDPGSLLKEVKPEIIILAAHVEPSLKDYLLRERAKIFLQNCGCRRLIYISSDAVFDGRRGLYDEDDAISPAHDYGHGLAFMETAVRQICADHVVVRPSYLYGFSGGGLDSRLATTRNHLLRNEKASFFNDMFKSPLEVNQAANVILEAAAMQFVGTLHVAGPRLSVFDFQRKGMQALGVPIHHLVAERIPADAAFLRDTSLSIERMVRLIGEPPRPICEALTNNQLHQQ